MKMNDFMKKYGFWIGLICVVILGSYLIFSNFVFAEDVCKKDSDCVAFGESGECNCGCYLKDDVPADSGGACFCAAPTSCECVSGSCEGVFE
jgi:hypothetical protein